MDYIGATRTGGMSSLSGTGYKATPKEIQTVNNGLNKPGKVYPTVRTLLNQGKSKAMSIDFGNVTRTLPDDNNGLKHQLFIVKTDDGAYVKVAHNTDLAPSIKYIKPGMRIGMKGEFIKTKDLKNKSPEELQSMGISFDPFAGLMKNESLDGVFHWTHHTPSGSSHDNGGLVVLDPGPNYGKIYD